MEDLDSALNELGMLSSVTKYKLDYLQAIETAAEVRRSRSGSAPETERRVDEDDKEVTIKVNSNFVTNIAVCSRTPPDLSPFMTRRLQMEIEDKRLRDNTGGHNCDRHSCNSSHICSFVSPRRNRTVTRNSPYMHGFSYPKFSPSPFILRPRPSVSPISGVLISSSSSSSVRSKSGGKLRGPVRFHDPCSRQSSSPTSMLYPLDEDITSKLSSIQLTTNCNTTGQNGEEERGDVASDMSRLAITRSNT